MNANTIARPSSDASMKTTNSMSARSAMRRGAQAVVLGASFALAACAGGGDGRVVFVPAPANAGPAGGGSQSPSETYATPIPAGQIDAAVAKLDELAADIMRRSNIPGMAVAVVKDGPTVAPIGFDIDASWNTVSASTRSGEPTRRTPKPLA